MALPKYNANRVRNIYDPRSQKPFRISRTKIDLFIRCPRCFYLDRRLGINQPPSYPFSLNSAVDALLKKEFDNHRQSGTPHPLMTEFGIDAVPFQHEKIEEWRDALHSGITFHDTESNLIFTGGVDDIWKNKEGELHVVDYKATAKTAEVTLDEEWQDGYRRQVEIYQWLLRKNGFRVSDIAYFVYCNGMISAERFNGRLEFRIKVLPHKGTDKWIGKTVKDIFKCLQSTQIPQPSKECPYCAYRASARKFE